MMATQRTAALALAGVLLAATACGSSSEEGIEQLIERETGEDVELDFDDDGSFSLETEDGSMSVDEDGNFVVVGEDGEVITGDIDQDGDSINIETDDGDASVQVDDGGLAIETDEGDVSFQTSTDIPDEWPAEVPQPTGLNVVSGATFTDGGQTGITIVATYDGDLAEFVASYSAALEAAGLPQTGTFESEGSISVFHEGDTWIVTVAGGAADGVNNVSISVLPADG